MKKLLLILFLSLPVLFVIGQGRFPISNAAHLAAAATGRPTVMDDGDTYPEYIAHTDYLTLGLTGVISWEDASDSAFNLATQGSDSAYWSTDHVSFAGTSKLKNYDWNTATGFTVWMVVYMDSWTGGDEFFVLADGAVDFNQYPASDRVRVSTSGGSFNTDYDDQALDTWYIIKIIVNGASSEIQYNENTAITGNAGTFTAADQAWLGHDVDCADFDLKHFIYRNTIDTSGDEDDIRDWLNSEYSVY